MTDLDDVEASTGSPPVTTTSDRLSDWTAHDTVGEARHAPAALRRENQDLRDALASQPVIDQAKGALMLRYRLDAESAFGLMVRWSQAANIKVREIAQALVEAITSGEVGSVDPLVARELEQVLQRGARDG